MQNQLRTVALLGLLSGLLIAISYWLVGGNTGVVIGIALAALTNNKLITSEKTYKPSI